MHRWTLSFVFVLAGAISVDAHGQVVQLPTFHTFGGSMTVLVPDRGAVNLGGVSSAASGSNQFGAFGVPFSRSSGSSLGASQMQVTARIHDFEAMDRALLEQAARMRGERGDSIATYRREVPRDGSTSSVAALSARKPRALSPSEELALLRQKAVAAEAKGEQGAARVYRQMIARREQSRAFVD